MQASQEAGLSLRRKVIAFKKKKGDKLRGCPEDGVKRSSTRSRLGAWSTHRPHRTLKGLGFRV